MSLEPSRVCEAGDFSDMWHSEIARRLETLKAAGLITDYFISWIGRNGTHAPVVRAWIEPDTSEADARDQINTLLTGIIRASNLVIIMNDRPSTSGRAVSQVT